MSHGGEKHHDLMLVMFHVSILAIDLGQPKAVSRFVVVVEEV